MTTETTATIPEASAPVTTTAYVTVGGALSGARRRNFFISSGLIGFTGMLFQFTVTFFFTLQLQSVAIVGAFLALGNLCSLLLDVPVGRLQKYFSAKKLYMIAGAAQLASGLIFLKFLLKFGEYEPQGSGIIQSALGFVFGSFLNIALLVLCSLLYGFAKEVNDITTLSYILDNASPDEVASITSTNNIVVGLGSVGGLLLAGLLLTADKQFFAIIVLVAVIIGMLAIIARYFDNSETTLDLASISHFRILLKKDGVSHLKDAAVAEIAKADIAKILEHTGKYIFLAPMQVIRIPFRKMLSELKVDTIKTFQTIFVILRKQPPYITLRWTMIGVLLFGFWDTVAATFLIKYLDELKNGWSSILLLCLAVPAFGLQWPFIGLSRKIGSFSVVLMGSLLSGGSLIALAFAPTDSLLLPMMCALCNSVGYAMGMALAQEGFLNVYNDIYAKELSLTEIQSNASAAPMKILQNFANVIGLAIGGVMITVLDFGGLFFTLGIGFLTIAGWSISQKTSIKI